MATISGNVEVGQPHEERAADVLLLNSRGTEIIAVTQSDAETGYYEFAGLPDARQYRILVRGNPTYRSRVFGPVFSSEPISVNTDTLDGWTSVGPQSGVSADFGSPAPSIYSQETNHLYRELPVAVAPGLVIEFDSYTQPGTYPLGDFVFGANSSGNGSYVRLEYRQGDPCGIGTRQSWLSGSVPNRALHPAIALGSWRRVRIRILTTTLAEWYLDGAYIGAGAVGVQGNYFGVVANGNGVSLPRTNIDNLSLYTEA